MTSRRVGHERGAPDHAKHEFDPYRIDVDGPFGFVEAAHFLGRTEFGASPTRIAEIVTAGPAKAVDDLLDSPRASPWDDVGHRAAKRHDIEGLEAQWLLRLVRSRKPFRDRLAFFWHDHFATSVEKVKDPLAMFRQNHLFVTKGTGSFRELLRGIARDPAMVRWLDGDRNKKRAPNENFGRELLELFTLGRGHYTERDVREVSRAFTGWGLENGRFRYSAVDHDDGSKTVLGRTAKMNGDDVIDHLATLPACARFIAIKLYRAFVEPGHGEFDDNRARRLERIMTEAEFDIARFLRRLLTSRRFYSAAVRKAVVKSPVHLVVGALRTLTTQADYTALARAVAVMGQRLYAPPSVDGWPTGRAWLHPTGMVSRLGFAREVRLGPEGNLGVKRGDDAHAVEEIVAALMAESPVDRDHEGDRDAIIERAMCRPRFQLA